ncbi:alpha/beta fold hydrolase [Acetobacter thailandicus]|uniref:alpha/beta fold hydrolase n=1 Tax=Acetobacter thailandicus TaxID=1502842 RepID=UPI001BA7889E|nr:alpha/beta fold hydrolase [Acetobacter thailandicus]MBS0981270.1 alpha/beta hydrolase [Acetobacter thailandicus]
MQLSKLLACNVLCGLLLATAAHAETEKAGVVVKASPLPAAFSLPGAGAAYRVVYLSTDGLTQKGLVQATEEVILPKGKPPAGGWPVVAWEHGTVGVSEKCTPSLHPYTERNRTYLEAWMKRGFAVVAPDYQGLGISGQTHAYLNTRVEAYSVLDGLRAAESAYPLQNKVMLVGQSQGGGAAVASASFAPTYAPDINILGTVATGVPYITPELMETLLHKARSNQPAGGYDPLVVYSLYIAAGLAAHDSSFNPQDVFTEKAMSAYHAAGHSCVNEMMALAGKEGLNANNSLKPDFEKVLMPAFKAMAYPTLKFAQPLFVGTGTADKDVPPLMQYGLVKAACAAGTIVQAHTYEGLNHGQTVNASLPDSAVFTSALLEGKPVASTCHAFLNWLSAQ